MMKVLVLALALVLCCSCATGKSKDGNVAAINPKSAVAATQMIFYVSDAYDAVFYEAAEQFAARMKEITGGSVDISVRSVGADVDIRKLSADFFYADADADRWVNSFGGMLSSPMRYKSYRLFSAALNSREVVDILSTDSQKLCGKSILATFYPGSNIMLSSLTASNLRSMTGKAGLDKLAAAAVDPATAEMFRAAGLEVAEEINAVERGRLLAGNELQLAEFTVAELEELRISTLALYTLQTCHTARPIWLCGGQQLKSLSEMELAALEEAKSYMFAVIDDHYLGIEQNALEKVRGRGATKGGDFSEVREQWLKSTGAGETLTPDAQYVLDLLGSLK